MTAPGQGRGAPPLEQAAQDTLGAVRGRQYGPAAIVLPPEPPPMTEEERRLAEEAAAQDSKICAWCLGVHKWPTSVGCPRIASAELDGEGQVRKVAFWPGTDWAKGRLTFVEDLLEDGDAAEMPPVTKMERAWLIDALMVLMHRIESVPENDKSELPQMQSLLERLMGVRS